MVPREPIFDDRVRDDQTPGNHSESHFAFLNRVGGAYWQYPRDLIQDWADRINRDADYNEMRTRLRRDSSEVFRSAFFELFLHESFRRGGWNVEVHPAIPDGGRHPDFRVQRDSESFYVEAITPGTSSAAAAAANRQAVLLDLLNDIHSPNHFLAIRTLEVGPSAVATKRMRSEIEHWLESQDPSTPFESSEPSPYVWSKNGWELTLTALPKRQPSRRGRDRAIGIYAATTTSTDNSATIRTALEKKSSRYGALNSPYLVAVSTYMFESDLREVPNALLGSDSLYMKNDSVDVVRARRGDGFFGTAGDFRHRQVSGVLIVNQLMPWSILRADSLLWRHPSATYDLPDDLNLPFGEMVWSGSEATRREGQVAAADHFGLPTEWPPNEEERWNY